MNSPKTIGFVISSIFNTENNDPSLSKRFNELVHLVEKRINAQGGIAGIPIKIHIYKSESKDNFYEILDKEDDIYFLNSIPYGANLDNTKRQYYFFFDDPDSGSFDPTKDDNDGKGIWTNCDSTCISTNGWRSEVRSLTNERKSYIVLNSSYFEEKEKLHPSTPSKSEYLKEAKQVFEEYEMEIMPFDNLHLDTTSLKEFIKNLSEEDILIVSNRIHPIDAQPGKEYSILGDMETSVIQKFYDDVHLAFVSTHSRGSMISIGLQNDEAYRALLDKKSIPRKKLLSLKDPTFQSYIRLQDLYYDIDPKMKTIVSDALAENNLIFDQIKLVKYVFDRKPYTFIDRESFLKECSKRLSFLNGIDDVFIGDNTNIQFNKKNKNVFNGALLSEYSRNSIENELIDITLYKKQLPTGILNKQTKPVDVNYINIDVLRIKDISIEEGTFVAKFYFEITTPHQEGIEIITFNNSTLDSDPTIIKFNEEKIDDSYTHFRYLIEDKFSFESIADNYPFDKQVIYISYSVINNSVHGVLQPIQKHDIDINFEMDGWEIESTRSGIFREKIKQKSVLSTPSSSITETNRVAWIVKRASSMTLLKVLIPLSFLWSLVIYGLFLPIENLDRSVAVITTSFLSAIALYFSTERPQPLIMTVIDYIFAAFYLTVGISSIAVFVLNFFPDVYDQYMSIIKFILPLSAIFVFSFINIRIKSKKYIPRMYKS